MERHFFKVVSRTSNHQIHSSSMPQENYNHISKSTGDSATWKLAKYVVEVFEFVIMISGILEYHTAPKAIPGSVALHSYTIQLILQTETQVIHWPSTPSSDDITI